MLDFFKKKTELDLLKSSFSFLVKAYGYDLIKAETQDFYKGKNLLIYENARAQKQIEICGGASFFHCIIRKMNNGELTEYPNQNDNIGLEDLAIVDNPDYEHFDYYAGGSTGVDGVTQNTVALFKRQEHFLRNDDWVDLNHIEKLKDRKYKSRFGDERPRYKAYFIDEVKSMVNTEFPEFELIFDNRKLPFYHEDSTLQKLVFDWRSNKIAIAQYDWRDYPEVYRVFLNEEKVSEVEAKESEGIDKIREACKNIISKY